MNCIYLTSRILRLLLQNQPRDARLLATGASIPPNTLEQGPPSLPPLPSLPLPLEVGPLINCG